LLTPPIYIRKLCHQIMIYMTQTELSENLVGKIILKINYKEQDDSKTNIESIMFSSGDLLTLGDETKLSHPEKEEENAAFYEALNNVPLSGIVTFKAKYLSQGLIDREIAVKHKELKSNGYGQVKSNRQDYLTYRFDMPDK